MDGNLENNQTVYNLNGKIEVIPFVDSTLTKSGYSADAKVTGDALKEIREAVSTMGVALTGLEDVEVIPTGAKSVTYDNTTSKLVATNVQGAIDELNTVIQTVTSNIQEATNNIQEIDTAIQTLETNAGEYMKKSDKAFDSYAGNGSTSARTVATGGTGRLLMVYCSTHIAFVTPKGARIIDLSGGSATWADAAKAYYLNGNLFLNTDNAALNASGVSYNYQCI